MSPRRHGGPPIGYGVVLAGQEVTVVRTRRGRGDAESRVVLRTETSPREVAALPAVMEMQAEVAAGEALVSLGVPAGAGLVRWLRTPFTSRSKAARILPSLLDVQLPFPLEQCAHAVAKIEPGEHGKVCALAVAARYTELTELLDAARERGIDPALMDHEALALWDHARSLGRGGPLAVAHLGRTRGVLAIGDGGRLDSAHALPAAVAASTASDAALLSRLRHLLRSRQPDPDRPLAWVWAGAAAADKTVRDPLEAALKAELPGVLFAVAPEPETFLAGALARRAAAGDADAWNLRRGALEHPSLATRRRRDARRTAVAALVAGVCLVAVNLGWRTVLDQRGLNLDSLILEQAQRMTGLPESALRVEPVHVVRTHLASRSGPDDPFREAMAPGVTDVLYRVASLAARLQLSLHGFSASEGSFVISGSGPDADACRRLAEQWDDAASPLDLNVQSEQTGRPTSFTARGVYGSP